MSIVRYTVAPVDRFAVWKQVEEQNGGGCECIGEFDSEIDARNVSQALALTSTLSVDAPEMVIRHDGVSWDRQSGMWSDQPDCADLPSVG